MNKTNEISIRVTPVRKQEIKELADSSGLTVTQLIELALARYELANSKRGRKEE